VSHVLEATKLTASCQIGSFRIGSGLSEGIHVEEYISTKKRQKIRAKALCSCHDQSLKEVLGAEERRIFYGTCGRDRTHSKKTKKSPLVLIRSGYMGKNTTVYQEAANFLSWIIQVKARKAYSNGNWTNPWNKFKSNGCECAKGWNNCLRALLLWISERENFDIRRSGLRRWESFISPQH